MILAVLCLASFAGAIAPLSGQLNLADQEKLYNKSKIEESYAVCLNYRSQPNISTSTGTYLTITRTQLP
jgi:hypothetical protein